MLFPRLTVDVPRTKSATRQSAPRRHRTLRFESLERRELLTTVNDFAGLRNAVEHGLESDIELGCDIVIDSTCASETITLSTGTFTINGNGNKITVGTGVTRTASLFTVRGGSLTLSNLTVDGLVYSGGNGAVFNQDGGTVTINSGTVISNCAAQNGGVGYLSGGSLSVGSDAGDDAAITFKANTAANAGVFYAKDSTFTIDHGTFGGNSASDGNTCTQGGGVLYLNGSAAAVVNGGTFKNNRASDAGRGGGVFRLYGVTASASVTINGGTFDSNSTAGKGGVIFADGGTITINGGTISNNTARSGANNGGGGVIYANGAGTAIAINGGTITGNSATGTTTTSGGGVIYAHLASTVTIGGGATLIENNTADKGGVIYVDNNGASAVTISGGTISGNSAVGTSSSGGGVIYVGNTGTATAITISGGTISGNSSTGGSSAAVTSGGGVVNIYHGGNLTISGGTISGNTADKYGGVVHANDHSSITISGGTIESNTADRGGVTYNNRGANIVINNNAVIRNNEARQGAVSFMTWGPLTINGGIISGNTASGDGGVVFVDDGAVNINGGTISGNTAHRGGVVYTNQNKEDTTVVTISGGTILNNKATGELAGGVAFINQGKITISGGTISGNEATHGEAGVIYSRGDVTIEGGTISGNTARTGGVVYLMDHSATVTIKKGAVLNTNTASSGGVVYVHSGHVDIKGGIFSGNEATHGDGGVVFTNAGTLTIEDGTFSGNSASGCGGVIFGSGEVSEGVIIHSAAVVVNGGTFTSNSAATGGVFCATIGSTITVNDGLFGGTTGETPWEDGNSAHDGGVFYLHSTTANILGGTFNWNTASSNGGICCMTNRLEHVVPRDDATLNVTGGSFAHNTALLGGVFYLSYDPSATGTSTTVYLASVTMADNSAVNGGAIANHGGIVADADTTAVKTFTGNSATGNGGAIFSSGNVTLSNADFTNNYCVGNGGAVDNLSGSNLTLTGAEFSGNSSLAAAVSLGNVNWAGLDSEAGDGGAIQNWGTATLVDAYFTGNSAHDGGAIANGEGAHLTLSQTTASSNNAPLGFSGNGAVYGGAIINVGTLTRAVGQGGTAETAAIEFARNISYNNGGAISNSNNNGTVTQTGSLNLYKLSFTNNTAGSAVEGNTHTGSGGAVISANDLTITGSIFSGNNACDGGKGGAIDHNAGTLTLTGDTFTGNSASGTGFGGAVNTWAGGTITDCEFTGNDAKFGGAVSVLGNDVITTITHSADNTTSFSENEAVSYGGAVYASGTVEIDGAAISRNTASLGGGILVITSELTVSGSAQKGRGKVIFTGSATTFSNNTATTTVDGQGAGSDICATSSNSAAGNGAVIEIETLPSLGSGGYQLAVDRSFLVLASGVTLPSTLNIYSNKEFTCGYTYSGGTLAFTSLSSDSGTNKWRIYWSGSDTGPGSYTEYTGSGTLPSGTVASGTTVLIKGYRGTRETIYYMIPTESTNAGAASEALFDEALFDDAEVFSGLAPQSSALEEYCDECFL